MAEWEVWSPSYATYYGWRLDPPEYGCDWARVEAETAREAKVKAVRQWRAERSSRIADCQSDGASPFTGVKATLIYPGPYPEELEASDAED